MMLYGREIPVTTTHSRGDYLVCVEGECRPLDESLAREVAEEAMRFSGSFPSPPPPRHGQQASSHRRTPRTPLAFVPTDAAAIRATPLAASKWSL